MVRAAAVRQDGLTAIIVTAGEPRELRMPFASSMRWQGKLATFVETRQQLSVAKALRRSRKRCCRSALLMDTADSSSYVIRALALGTERQVQLSPDAIGQV
jgi:hypothetical protein